MAKSLDEEDEVTEKDAFMSAEMSDQKPEPATLQVAGESPATCKLDIEERVREIDIAERDPNDMNGHIKVSVIVFLCK